MRNTVTRFHGSQSAAFGHFQTFYYYLVSVSEKIIVGPHGVPDPPSLAQMTFTQCTTTYGNNRKSPKMPKRCTLWPVEAGNGISHEIKWNHTVQMVLADPFPQVMMELIWNSLAKVCWHTVNFTRLGVNVNDNIYVLICEIKYSVYKKSNWSGVFGVWLGKVGYVHLMIILGWFIQHLLLVQTWGRWWWFQRWWWWWCGYWLRWPE